MEDEIKRKMLQERMQQQFMQQQLQGQMQQQMQQKQTEEILKVIKMQILDDNARERLNNLKITKYDLAFQIELYLAQLYQAGQIRTRITDAQMVSILQKFQNKKEPKIRIR